MREVTAYVVVALLAFALAWRFPVQAPEDVDWHSRDMERWRR